MLAEFTISIAHCLLGIPWGILIQYKGALASQVSQCERIYLPMKETQDTWIWSLGREDPME